MEFGASREVNLELDQNERCEHGMRTGGSGSTWFTVYSRLFLKDETPREHFLLCAPNLAMASPANMEILLEPPQPRARPLSALFFACEPSSPRMTHRAIEARSRTVSAPAVLLHAPSHLYSIVLFICLLYCRGTWPNQETPVLPHLAPPPPTSPSPVHSLNWP